MGNCKRCGAYYNNDMRLAEHIDECESINPNEIAPSGTDIDKVAKEILRDTKEDSWSSYMH